uniref:DUF3990 domain-containing protein n=1 Tax=Prevotella sp. TaxID=59823 RepID=UPI00402A4B23
MSKSKDFKDFGRGFYLTKDYTRAVAMAQRTTAIIGEGCPEVSPFIFNPSRCPIDVRIKKFDGRTAEWALFVLRNREKSTLNAYKHDYDIVISPVADSPYYRNIVGATATYTPIALTSTNWQNS